MEEKTNTNAFGGNVIRPKADIINVAGRNLSIYEVDSETEGYDEAIGVRLPSDRDCTEEEINTEIIKKISEKYWWLREQPIEQVSITFGNQEVEVYNYYKILSDEHIKDIQTALIFFDSLMDEPISDYCKYVVFNNKSVLNSNTGIITDEKIINGEAYRKGTTYEDQIWIDPHGFDINEPYRIKGVNNTFQAVFIHELSHILEYYLGNDFTDEWCERFGWIDRLAYDKDKIPAPETCINEYALNQASDDFAESMVAFLLNPQSLIDVSKEKFDFINEKVLSRSVISEKDVVTKVEQKTSNQITYPEILEPILYELQYGIKAKTGCFGRKIGTGYKRNPL